MRGVRVFTVLTALASLAAMATPMPATASDLPAKFAADGACAARFAAASGQGHGIDVSKFQGEIDWADLERQGLHFVIMRAAYGTRRDDEFDRNWQDAAGTCMLRSAYQFYLGDEDPTEQAKAFAELIQAADAGAPELHPVVDVEGGSHKGDLCKDKAAAKAFSDRLATYLKAFEAASGRQMMIYTAHYFWQCLAPHPDLPGDRPLWVASYDGRAAPEMPPGWSAWHFWQRTDRAEAEGIDGKVDGDLYHASPATLLRAANP